MSMKIWLVNKVQLSVLIMGITLAVPLLALQEQQAMAPEQSTLVQELKKERKTWKKFFGVTIVSSVMTLGTLFCGVGLIKIGRYVGEAMLEPIVVAYSVLACAAMLESYQLMKRNVPDKQARNAAGYLLSSVAHGTASVGFLSLCVYPVLWKFANTRYEAYGNTADTVVQGFIWACFVPTLLYQMSHHWEKAKERWAKYKNSEDGLLPEATKTVLAGN